MNDKWPHALELAVRFGKVLLMKEVEGINQLLVNILRKDLMGHGGRRMVRIGEKYVDFNEGFRLFLVTRYSEIQLSPTERALVTMVNFTVTKSGLEEKLLSIVINKEKPDLEQKKSQYLK